MAHDSAHGALHGPGGSTGPGAGPRVGDELVAHGAWVRELARSLVRVSADADDVAQDAQLAAWTRGRTVRGALGPWLAQVTRNFARRAWRDGARRAGRERAAARTEAQPGADEVAARLDVQRVLLEELAALEPAVRHAVVRRYFDGWTAARIAKETGEPQATVRWRVQRGLAELRGRLDRRSGGDGLTWRLALLPVCGDPTPWMALKEALEPLERVGLGAGAIPGALTMKAASQALAAGVMAAAVGLGVWWTVERVEAPRAGAPAVTDEPRELAPAPAIVAPAEPLAPAAQPAVAAERVARPSAPPPAAPAAPAPLRIEGRCVDTGLRPLAGARAGQLADVSASEAAVSVLTGGDGTFALDVAKSVRGACAVELAADGCETRRIEITLPAEGTTYLGDVVLDPGGSVRGRVVDAFGAPFHGAPVAVTSPDLWGTLQQARDVGPRGQWQLTGESGPDGSFEVAGVAVGPMRAWAGAKDMRWAVSAPIEVRAHQATEEVELVLEPLEIDNRITGVVLAPDGAPVPNASVNGMQRTGGSMSSFAVATDDRGWFEIDAKRGYTYDFDASDPADRWTAVGFDGVEPGTQDLELRFEEARWIDVRVHVAGGTALEDYFVAALDEESRGARLSRIGQKGPHAEGAARVRVPGETFWVQVEARGYAPGVEGPFASEEPPSALAFELEPEPGLRGRVLDGERPLADARVVLYEADPRARIDHQGYPSLVGPHELDETRTDDEGRFVLAPRKRSTFVVRAETDGFAPGDTAPLEFDPAVGRDEVEIALAAPGALEGRVLVAVGRDPGGVIVALNRGDAFPLTQRSDAEGRFRFEGLTPGQWHLSRGHVEVNPQGGGTAYSTAGEPTSIPFNVTVRAGETLVSDLDLRDWEPCELLGMLRVNGAPAKDWTVRGWPGAAQAYVGDLPTTSVASDGSFALVFQDRGPVRLSFSPPPETGARGNFDVITEVVPGANVWDEDLAMGRLVGRLLSPSSTGALFYNAAEESDVGCWVQVVADASGRFELPFVPVGPGSFRRLEEAENGEGRWVTLLETEVQAGAERSVDVP